jgi:hypothetical protein
MNLVQHFSDNLNANFFFDEVLFGKSGITMENFSNFSSKVDDTNYIWGACQSGYSPSEVEMRKWLPGKFLCLF